MKLLKVRAENPQGGSKCQHSTRKAEGGLELIMECHMCGTGTLKGQNCYHGTVRAIQQQGVPSGIILRSHVERRYDSRSTRIMGQIAEIINRIEDLRNILVVDSRKGARCTECLATLIKQLDEMKGQFLNRDIEGGIRRSAALGKYNFRSGVRCDECAGMALVHIGDISKLARSLENEVIAGTIGITEAGP